MKKIIIMLTVLLSFVCVNNVIAQNSYKDVFKKANNTFNMAIHFGGIGCSQGLGLQEFLVSTTIKGVYADFGGWPSKHGSDVDVDVWDDDKALTCHLGYQVPVTNWLRIIPMVGYAYDATGTTDGYNWSCDSNGIHNKFNIDEKVEGLDYGAAVVFNINHVNIQGTYTKYNWYIGIGYEF